MPVRAVLGGARERPLTLLTLLARWSEIWTVASSCATGSGAENDSATRQITGPYVTGADPNAGHLPARDYRQGSERPGGVGAPGVMADREMSTCPMIRPICRPKTLSSLP